MGVRLNRIRLSNFRSFQSAEAELGETTILIGKNNSGKSNLLSAVGLLFSTTRTLEEDDVFRVSDQIDKDSIALIDAQIRPTDADGNLVDSFSRSWTLNFTNAWISLDRDGVRQSLNLRAEISYDRSAASFIVRRYILSDWDETTADATRDRSNRFSRDALDRLSAPYIDAHRDITSDIRRRNSYFARATAESGFSEDFRAEIEHELSDINRRLVEESPALTKTTQQLSHIGGTVGAPGARIEIEPLAGRIADLYKGVDIFYSEDMAARLPAGRQGMGTRSWIAFLTLSAFVESNTDRLRKTAGPDAENHDILLMEEPEAHLHPQAQRQLFEQIHGFRGQEIITTHSPAIAAQADLRDLLFVRKTEGRSVLVRLVPPEGQDQFSGDDLRKITCEVIRTRGDLLFTDAVILCEGQTEETVLPIYYEARFGHPMLADGVCVVGVGGTNYAPFIRLLHRLGIPWFVFSDGEEKTLRKVDDALRDAAGVDLEGAGNVVYLERELDYETYLCYEGYLDEVVRGLEQTDSGKHGFNRCVRRLSSDKGYRDKMTRRYEEIEKRLRESGRELPEPLDRARAACIQCATLKTRCAEPVARRIAADPSRLPPKITELLDKVASGVGLDPGEATAR